ncbi:hypothetical protein [Streptomyces sp. NPDC059881]|uniref:hypothetical protein n=1 Tax=Streptomyces sp. NPDC059881 TaxID=3346986 RepID=UPI0036641A9F
MAISSTAKRPIHQVRQAADDSRDVNHWFSFLAPIPSSLAGTNRLVVSVRPYVVEAAPGLTPNPGISLPPASTSPCEDWRRASHPARSISASWRTAEFVDAEQVDAAADDAAASAAQAATSATTARNAANRAEQDAIAAEESAAQAEFSAHCARTSADQARRAAEDAEASALVAGKSAEEAADLATAAWKDVVTKREAELAEARRLAEESARRSGKARPSASFP